LTIPRAELLGRRKWQRITGRGGSTHGCNIQKYALSPEDLLHFIETTVFTKAWNELDLNDEDDLMALQLAIMSQPKAWPVVQGTGGLRKLRFVPPGREIGKSGGVRVCYVYFEEFGIVLLVYVYDKRKQGDLSEAEKKVIRDYIRREKKALDRRQGN
jgi:hypothetical protein